MTRFLRGSPVHSCLWLLMLSLFFSAAAHAAVTPMVEDLTDGGFDSPGWYPPIGDGEFIDEGYRIVNHPTNSEPSFDKIGVVVPGGGSFVSTLEILDFDLGDIDNEFGCPNNSRLIVHHGLAGGFLQMHIAELDRNPVNEWLMMVFGKFSTGTFFTFSVQKSPPSGTTRVQTVFDMDESTVTFTFDNDIEDEAAASEFGPFEYIGDADANTELGLEILMTADEATCPSSVIQADGIFRTVSVLPLGFPGDLNNDDLVSVDDLDLLSEQIRLGSEDSRFDLNGDAIVNSLDRSYWVIEINGTFFGDSNLDGEFDSRDFVDVFVAAEYEDDIEGNSSWAEGDWNGDGDFNSRDLVKAFQDAGYEQGPRQTAAFVPEPSMSITVMLWAFVYGLMSRRVELPRKTRGSTKSVFVSFRVFCGRNPARTSYGNR